MRASDLAPGEPQEPAHGIDRIYFEHDSANFGNKMMWVPVARAAKQLAARARSGRSS